MSGIEFYKDKADLQKVARSACSEIDANNWGGAHKQINTGIETASKYLDPHQMHLPPYQPKQSAATPQKQADATQAKKWCKDAVSEVDFGNLQAVVKFLAMAGNLVNKY
jgi:hypothetical protein